MPYALPYLMDPNEGIVKKLKAYFLRGTAQDDYETLPYSLLLVDTLRSPQVGRQGRDSCE